MNGLFNTDSKPGSYNIERNLSIDQFPSDLDSLPFLPSLDINYSQKYLNEDNGQGAVSASASSDLNLFQEFSPQKSLWESEPQYENYSELSKMLDVLLNADDHKLEFYPKTNEKLDNLHGKKQKINDTCENEPLQDGYLEANYSHNFNADAEVNLQAYPTINENSNDDTRLEVYPFLNNSEGYSETNGVINCSTIKGNKQIVSTYQMSEKVCHKRMIESHIDLTNQSCMLPSTSLNSNEVSISSSPSSSVVKQNKKLRLDKEIPNTVQPFVSNIPTRTYSSLTANEMSAVEKYNERRRRNNIASRKSRENRKKKNQNDLIELEELSLKNEELKQKIRDLEECLEKAKEELFQKLK
ncbi:uncharacterized protein LOC115212945 [Argonauta hians]